MKSIIQFQFFGVTYKILCSLYYYSTAYFVIRVPWSAILIVTGRPASYNTTVLVSLLSMFESLSYVDNSWSCIRRSLEVIMDIFSQWILWWKYKAYLLCFIFSVTGFDLESTWGVDRSENQTEIVCPVGFDWARWKIVCGVGLERKACGTSRCGLFFFYHKGQFKNVFVCEILMLACSSLRRMNSSPFGNPQTAQWAQPRQGSNGEPTEFYNQGWAKSSGEVNSNRLALVSGYIPLFFRDSRSCHQESVGQTR